MEKLERAYSLENMSPQLVADVWFYPTDKGGKTKAARAGWGCPCMLQDRPPFGPGWDCRLLLGDQVAVPGGNYRLGFVFLSEEASSTLLSAGKFYLWEGRVVGEATVVTKEQLDSDA